jgi:hypothetical protein
MGQNLPLCAQLGATRSRQDESNEVHEAGRIRRPSGGKGGHVLSLHPLIWRSLSLSKNGRARRHTNGWARNASIVYTNEGCIDYLAIAVGL